MCIALAIVAFGNHPGAISGQAQGDDGLLAGIGLVRGVFGPRHKTIGPTGADGMVQPVFTYKPLSTSESFRLAVTDHFSPAPFYAYSTHGVESAWTHNWNKQQMMSNPWHGGNSYWRFGTPTALVVPPTAGFQTNYGWGVGQTTSTPIYHQFGRGGAGMIGGGAHFPNAPYWPSNTNQMGVYPVRAPWGGFN